MTVRGTHSARGRLVQSVTVAAVALAGLTAVATSAYFTDSAAGTGNTFTTGSVTLTATPATSARPEPLSGRGRHDPLVLPDGTGPDIRDATAPDAAARDAAGNVAARDAAADAAARDADGAGSPT